MVRAAEIVVAILVVARLSPAVLVAAVLVAAVTVSAVPLLVRLLSRTVGRPFVPESGVVQSVGLVAGAAALLELAAIVAAVLVLRAPGWARPHSAGQHLGRLALVAVVAVTVVGLGGGISLAGPTVADPDTGHTHGAATAAALA